MKTLLSIIALFLVMVGVKAQTIEMQIFGDAPAVVMGTSTQVAVDSALRPYPQVVTDAVNAKGKVVAIETEKEESRGFTEDVVRTKVVLGAQYSQADNTVHSVHNLPPKERSLPHGFGWWWCAGLLSALLSVFLVWRSPSFVPMIGIGASVNLSIAIANIACIVAVIALAAAFVASAVFAACTVLIGAIMAIVMTTKVVFETRDNEQRARGLKIAGLLYVVFMVIALPAFFYL